MTINNLSKNLHFQVSFFPSDQIQLKPNLKWKQHANTIAGGNGKGKRLNQLDCPQGISVDDDHQTIYIADCDNHRIVEWKFGAKTGQIIAGGNGSWRSNQSIVSSN